MTARKCRICGATSGLRRLIGSPLVADGPAWECDNGCLSTPAREPLDLARVDELLGLLSGADLATREYVAGKLAADVPALVAELRALRADYSDAAQEIAQLKYKVERDHVELRDRRTEDLELRGLLSPQGELSPPVPAEQIDAGVVQAVRWLIADRDRLAAQLAAQADAALAAGWEAEADRLDREAAALPEQTAMPGEPLPPLPDSVYPSGAEPLECGEPADNGGWFRCTKPAEHTGDRHTAAMPGGSYTWGYVPGPEDAVLPEQTAPDHRAIISRAHRHLIATGWRGDSLTPMSDDSTVYVLRRPGGRIEAHVSRTGKLAAVTLAGLSPEQIAGLARAVGESGE